MSCLFWSFPSHLNIACLACLPAIADDQATTKISLRAEATQRKWPTTAFARHALST